MKTKLAMLTLAALAAANAQADNEVAPVKADSVMMVGQTRTKTKKLKAVSADDDYQSCALAATAKWWQPSRTTASTVSAAAAQATKRTTATP